MAWPVCEKVIELGRLLHSGPICRSSQLPNGQSHTLSRSAFGSNLQRTPASQGWHLLLNKDKTCSDSDAYDPNAMGIES
jgi:hypothetical protein